MDEARIRQFLAGLAARPACPDCGDPQWAYCCSIARGEVLDRLDDDPRWVTVQSVLSRGMAALYQLSSVEWQLVIYHARGRQARYTRRSVVEVRDRLAALVRDLDGLLGRWPEEGGDWSAVAEQQQQEAQDDRAELRLRRVLAQVPSEFWDEF